MDSRRRKPLEPPARTSASLPLPVVQEDSPDSVEPSALGHGSGEDEVGRSTLSGMALVLMVNSMLQNDAEGTNQSAVSGVSKSSKVSSENPSSVLRAVQEVEKRFGGLGSLFSPGTGGEHEKEFHTTTDSTVVEVEPAPRPDSLDPQTDPFTPREGKTLTWKSVNMVLAAAKSGESERYLLDNVWGEVPKRETTAIMGPSGAGKTSLLNILAGRVVSRGRMRVSADVRLNNFQVDPSNIKVRQSIAFVAQDDSLPPTATPREAIRFSAKLRMPRSTTDAEIETLTNRMLSELGLNECADVIVGSALLKGISGGERKRTSVGVELVVKPAMVFLDEPTSGLDSFSAVQCCQVLRKVAHAGASVLFTIHQPSSEIFFAFDHLILLNKGRVMYQGSTDGVAPFFGRHGYPCPNNYNPADWMMTVAQANSREQLDEAGFFPKDNRNMGEAFLPDAAHDALGQTIRRERKVGFDARTVGAFTQGSLLFKRDLQRFLRDKYIGVARFGLAALLSFLVGAIYWGVGATSPSLDINIQSQFGAIMILLMYAMIGTAQPALLSFPDERPVFLREYSTNHYTVAAYFAARLTMEAVITAIQILIVNGLTYAMIQFKAPFFSMYLATYAMAMASTAMAVLVGCISGGHAKVAIQMLPAIFVPQILFTGFFVAPELVPVYLGWIQYICVMTYGVRLLTIFEFDNCSEDAVEAASCQRLLDNLRADPDDELLYWVLIVALFVFFRLAALYYLRRSAMVYY